MVANGPDQRDAGPSRETDQSLTAASLAPILESLLGVHSAPETAWLADAASTAAERGIGALYSLLYLVDASSGHLQGERPASSERIRGLAKLNQEFGANLTALKFDPGDMDAVHSVLQTGRASVVQAVGEALPLPMDRKLLGDVQHRLGVAEVWLAPLNWSGESLGLLVLLMPANASSGLPLAELLARHLAVALKNLRDKEAGRRRGELDAVRWVYDERRFNEQLNREISRARRHQRSLSVLLLRVQNFQDLRLRFGRFLAERLLRQIGATMEETMRYTDFLGAYNDDGFAGLLVEADQASAARARDRVLEALANVSLPQADLPDLRLDLLCATATLALDGETGEELTAAARVRLDERANEDAA
jgi:diguanylate cyclase (GGDEF)-like protein